jgi:RNA polymerase sigma factor (sigma-70 family)
MATLAPEIPVLAHDEAFEKLYRRYAKDVYHYALALLRNPADAEDVTQTTFMNAYRAFQRGQVVEKPQNWLIKIAHNVARSRYARSTRRVKEVPLEDHVDTLALPENERPNIEAVLRALGRLPFNQRAALVMRELEGKTYGEIADTLGVSVAAVETLIFRARRSLRLRASALRSLAAVPLPASLTGLFEGGGVVAGGGALFGGGFVVKAAVALLAGAMATSLGGGGGVSKADVAQGARPSTARAVTASTVRLAVQHRANARRVHHARVLRAHSALSHSVTSTHVSATGGSLDQSVRTPVVRTQSAPAPATQVPAAPTTPVDNVVSTVESAVSTAASTLPVQAPALPPLPAQTPALPKLP